MPPKAMPLLDRLMRHIQKGSPDECWPWNGLRTPAGYGLVYIRTGENDYTKTTAHRALWKELNGDIPKEIDVCHACDYPPCCNPAHLFSGTRSENLQDCVRKGRQKPNPKSKQDHPKTHMKNIQVEELRRIYAAGGINQTMLGAQFGISQSAVSAIIRGHTWKTT